MDERIKKYIAGELSQEEILQFRKDLNTDNYLRHDYEMTKSKTKPDTSKGRTVLYCVVAVASLVLIVMNGSSYVISNHLKSASSSLYSELSAPVARSANEVDELLETSYESIGRGDYKEACRSLDAVDKAIANQMKEEYVNEDVREYNQSVLSVQQQEADWYRAIILMQNRKVSKAKAALTTIAEENGIYAESAQALLDSKFHL